MNETRPKKMASLNVAVALGIICILLIAIIAYFTVTGISAQNSYNNLQNQNKQLQTWLFGNESLLFLQEVNITYLNSEITNLQNQLSNFTSPQLGFSNLTAVDNRTNPNSPLLQVDGTIHNFGINGTMATIFVTAYHDDGSIALNSELPSTGFYPPLLNIDGQSSINVNLNYYYNGSALSSWTVNLVELIYI